MQKNLRYLQEERERMQNALDENEEKLVTFVKAKEDQERDEIVFEQISKSSIFKADYYEPKPDHFMSDLIDF